MALRGLLVVLVLAITSIASPFYSPSSYTPIAPFFSPNCPPHDIIDDSYIVMFKDNVTPEAFSSHMQFMSFVDRMNPLDTADEDAGIHHVYNSIVAKGYAGKFSKEVLDMIRMRPEVKYVERDQVVRPHIIDDDEDIYPNSVQMKAPWGLARISRQNHLHEEDNSYVYHHKAGRGAIVYVVDSGVRATHSEFEGRAIPLKTYWHNESHVDMKGHGTHVAGTVASRTYGVAKRAEIRAIKVHNINGRGLPGHAATIGALETAVKDAAEEARKHPKQFKGAVINMSIGSSGLSRSMNDAAENAVRAGAHMVVSAGNRDDDACKISPASSELVITVGASAEDDSRASFSNWGQCVDVFAPGVRILSTINTGDEDTSIKSGTSMSAPHVAGLIAYFLSIYPHRTFNPHVHPDYISEELYAPRLFGKDEPLPLVPETTCITPLLMKKALIRLSSKDKLTDVRGSPNRIIFNNYRSEPDGLYGSAQGFFGA